jgi:oligosaccharyltransferase complex subunit beta
MQSHSIFFENLASRGHTLTSVQAESAELTLKKFGEYLYDNIIMFAPATQELNSVSFDDILEFIESGGNVLFAANERVSDGMRSFAESCGVEFDRRGSLVMDHFSSERVADTRYE